MYRSSLLLFALFVACSSEPRPEVISSYLNMKNAMVKSDSELVSLTETPLREAIEALPPSQNLELARAISALQAAQSLDEKRLHFASLSTALFDYIEENDIKADGLYYQFCPMAFNDEGAYWVSDEKQISNPYFGDKMLRCGTTKVVL